MMSFDKVLRVAMAPGLEFEYLHILPLTFPDNEVLEIDGALLGHVIMFEALCDIIGDIKALCTSMEG